MMIFSGAFGSGQRLPSSRTLAPELGVSRTTVITVFDHLAEEGLIDSHTGSGSFVCETLGTHLPTLHAPSAETMDRRHKNLKLPPCLEQSIARFHPRFPNPPTAFPTDQPAFHAFHPPP